MIFHILFILVLIILSGLFSGSETALFSLSGFQRKKISLRQGAKTNYISALLDSPRRTLATILIGNMFVNTAATSTATVIAVNVFGEAGVVISILFMTALLLLFGEVTPKIIAIHRAEEFSKFISYPLLIFSKIILPIRWLLQNMSGFLISIFTKNAPKQPYMTERELKALVSIGKKEGIIDQEEEHMIHTVFDFGFRRVSEIMTPRVDIIGADKNAKKEEIIDILKKSKFSKIPIYDKDADHIIGVIYTKEFMLEPKDDWQGYIKKPLFVPEGETIDDLLTRFQSERNYIAIIIDEFGGTSGLITLEDLLEEIVGEIRDEYDKDDAPIAKQKDGSYIISGKTPIKVINKRLGAGLPTEEATTINGFLLLQFGKVPNNQDSITAGGFNFIIIDIDKKENRINRVLMAKKS